MIDKEEDAANDSVETTPMNMNLVENNDIMNLDTINNIYASESLLADNKLKWIQHRNKR